MKALKPATQIAMLIMVGCVVGWGVVNTADAHPDYGCASCHVPHAAAADQAVPLWNPDHTTTVLTTNYSSDTMDAATSAPDGASKLCLSCHDGSYSHVDDDHSFASSARPTGNLGGLETSHPISFVYDAALAAADGELVDPTTLPSDILDANSKMQCTSCHDVHGTSVADIPDDPTTGTDESVNQPNLRWPYYSGYGVTAAFCRNCHLK